MTKITGKWMLVARNNVANPTHSDSLLPIHEYSIMCWYVLELEKKSASEKEIGIEIESRIEAAQKLHTLCSLAAFHVLGINAEHVSLAVGHLIHNFIYVKIIHCTSWVCVLCIQCIYNCTRDIQLKTLKFYQIFSVLAAKSTLCRFRLN